MRSDTFVLIDFVKKTTHTVACFFFPPFWTTQAQRLGTSLENVCVTLSHRKNLWISLNIWGLKKWVFFLIYLRKSSFDNTVETICISHFCKKSCFLCIDLLQIFAMLWSERWFVFCTVIKHLQNLHFLCECAWFLCVHMLRMLLIFLLQGAQVWLRHKEQLLPSTISSCDELSMVLTTEYGKVRCVAVSHKTVTNSLIWCVSYIKHLCWLKDERLCIFIPRPAKLL